MAAKLIPITLLFWDRSLTGFVFVGSEEYKLKSGVAHVNGADGDEVTVEIGDKVGNFTLSRPNSVERVAEGDIDFGEAESHAHSSTHGGGGKAHGHDEEGEFEEDEEAEEEAHQQEVRSRDRKKKGTMFRWIFVLLFVAGIATVLLSHKDMYTSDSVSGFAMTSYLKVIFFLALSVAVWQDSASRGQGWDFYVAIAALCFNYVLGSPRVQAGLIGFFPESNAFTWNLLGVVAGLLLLYAFAFYKGRDLATGAWYFGSAAFLYEKVGLGALSLLFGSTMTNTIEIWLFCIALLHMLIDAVFPGLGVVRVVTLALSTLFTLLFMGVRLPLEQKGIPVMWIWGIVILLNFVVAALGREHKIAESEEQRYSFAAIMDSFRNMFQENQYDSVTITVLLTYLALKLNWVFIIGGGQ